MAAMKKIAMKKVAMKARTARKGGNVYCIVCNGISLEKEYTAKSKAVAAMRRKIKKYGQAVGDTWYVERGLRGLVPSIRTDHLRRRRPGQALRHCDCIILNSTACNYAAAADEPLLSLSPPTSQNWFQGRVRVRHHVTSFTESGYRVKLNRFQSRRFVYCQ
jgi:hypothetical protein